MVMKPISTEKKTEALRHREKIRGERRGDSLVGIVGNAADQGLPLSIYNEAGQVLDALKDRYTSFKPFACCILSSTVFSATSSSDFVNSRAIGKETR
jgi:hypothetical protein